jgi:regulator of cell morphogenesis and NO signaling
MINRKIADLVEENYVNGFVLHYFGIKFYQYFSKTLQEVCDAKKINPAFLIKEMHLIQNTRHETVENKLREHSIDLILAYLKNAHLGFIKRKLPYLAELVQDIDERECNNKNVIADLKLLFPLFVQEFIEHIYEEEDTLFEYIQTLQHFKKGDRNVMKLFREMRRFRMSDFTEEHTIQKNEMQGIMLLTDGYAIDEGDNLRLKVLMHELKGFHQELDRHARVENEMLFPKALQMEQNILEKIRQLARLN